EVPGQRAIALALLADELEVRLMRAPPDADELVHWIARLHRLGDRAAVHCAPAPHDDEVRLLAADLKPLRRLVLHLGEADRDRQQGEAMLRSKRLEQRDRLLAVRMVEVQEGNLLTVEVV